MANQISIDSRANNQFADFVNLNAQNEALKKNVEQANKEAVLAEVLKSNDASQADAYLGGKDKPKETEQVTDIDVAIETISEFIKLSNQSVNFQKDDSTDKTVIKVFDTQSKELIKQFPSAEVLEIAQKIAELRHDVSLKTGILLDEKV